MKETLEEKMIPVAAIIPERLAKLISSFADLENRIFAEKAGEYILLGVEAESRYIKIAETGR